MLREHYDRSFGEFWREDLGLTGDTGYDWSTYGDRTIDALKTFLDRDRTGLAESSIQTLQYRLDCYLRAYRAANDTNDLVTPVTRDSDIPATNILHDYSKGKEKW